MSNDIKKSVELTLSVVTGAALIFTLAVAHVL